MRVLRAVIVAVTCSIGAWFGLGGVAVAVDTICYTYDTLGRLDLAEYDPSSGGDSSLDYAYDANHNITNTTEATSGSPACSTPSGSGISAPADDPGPGFNIASNSPPVAGNDNEANLNFNAGSRIIYVLANDSDPDGDPIEIIAVWGADHGTLTNNSGASISYDAISTGDDTFYYTIADDRYGEDTATVTIRVTGGGCGGEEC
mgnify:CR=1 FL=1